MTLATTMKLSGLALAILLIITGCATSKARTKQDGAKQPLVEKSVTLPAYSSISASSIVSVKYTQGPAQPAVVKTSAEMIDWVKLDVKNGKLYIYVKPDRKEVTYTDVYVYLTAPNVSNFSSSSASSVVMRSDINLPHEQIVASVSGAGSIRFQNINSKGIMFNISGAGSVQANNVVMTTGGDVNTKVSGAATFKVDSIRARLASVMASGACTVKVNALDATTANLSSTGACTSKFYNLHVSEVKALSAGACNLTLTGAADVAGLNASGAATLKAGNLNIAVLNKLSSSSSSKIVINSAALHSFTNNSGKEIVLKNVTVVSD